VTSEVCLTDLMTETGEQFRIKCQRATFDSESAFDCNLYSALRLFNANDDEMLAFAGSNTRELYFQRVENFVEGVVEQPYVCQISSSAEGVEGAWSANGAGRVNLKGRD